MSQLTYDTSFINSAYNTNKIYTNSVQLDQKYKVSTLQKVINTTKDTFGGTKKTTNYIIAPRSLPELEAFSRALILSLTKNLGAGYEPHLLNKRAEFWQPKGREEDVDFFNAVKFNISIAHETKKVWITPILTAHLGDDDIDREDEDGNSKRTYPTKLVVAKSAQEPLLIPKPLRRNLAITPDDEEDIDDHYSKNQ